MARTACLQDRRRKFVDNTDRSNEPDQASGDPRPAAVTFVTTEHFTLQGARSSTISESTGRASVFLGAVSGGLIALGLVATATKTGVAFYAFGLILLPTLGFVGLATFHRVLQSDRGPCIRAPYRAAPRLLLRSRSRAGPLPAQPRGRAAHPGAGDRPVAAIRDRRRDGRRDHRGTGRLSRRAARGRSFWPLAGSVTCRRRGRRRCGTDRADASSEFGLDPGHHGSSVPRRRSRPTLNPPGSARCAGLRITTRNSGGLH